jgi:hypothetical protein
MKRNCLSAAELAIRWHIKEATLNQWRWFGKGPTFFKLGSSVRYHIRDIEKFEEKQLHECMVQDGLINCQTEFGNTLTSPQKEQESIQMKS